MSMPKITANAVISELQAVTNQANVRLIADEKLAHHQGYHDYSRVIANFRNDLEKALYKAIDELTEDS